MPYMRLKNPAGEDWGRIQVAWLRSMHYGGDARFSQERLHGKERIGCNADLIQRMDCVVCQWTKNQYLYMRRDIIVQKSTCGNWGR